MSGEMAENEAEVWRGRNRGNSGLFGTFPRPPPAGGSSWRALGGGWRGANPFPERNGERFSGEGGGGGRQGEGGRKERKEIPMNLLKRGTAGRAGGIRDLHFQSEVLKPGEAFGLPPLRQMTFFYSLGGFNAG